MLNYVANKHSHNKMWNSNDKLQMILWYENILKAEFHWQWKNINIKISLSRHPKIKILSIEKGWVYIYVYVIS